MILWTTALVLGLGVLSLATMLQPPRSSLSADRRAKAQARRLAAKLMSKPADSASRQPASSVDPTLAFSTDPDVQQAIELTLPCRTKRGHERLDGRVNQVRLIGSTCDVSREVASTEVQNTTNGFAATVFPTGLGTFTTDYITLVRGKNEIVIRHAFEKGEDSERSYVLEREN